MKFVDIPQHLNQPLTFSLQPADKQINKQTLAFLYVIVLMDILPPPWKMTTLVIDIQNASTHSLNYA